VKLFIYYQHCTEMFFQDTATADQYAVEIGTELGWLSLDDLRDICESDLVPVEAWPGKPDADRCTLIMRQFNDPLR
jgi:hypothetical protein